jgi:hypothetical protein
LANERIRRAAGGHGLKLWQVAEILNMTDSSLSRKLRKDLPEEEQNRIIEAIRNAASSKGVC